MIYKDVVVNIKRLTAAQPVAPEAITLIVSTEADVEYKEYADLLQVAIDYNNGTVAYAMAEAFFLQTPSPNKLAMVGVTLEDDIDVVIAALNTVRSTNDDFNIFIVDTDTQANIEALMSWANTNQKYYIPMIPSSLVDTIAVPDNSDYVYIMVHDEKSVSDTVEYINAAVAGALTTYFPGSATWKFKTLVGITPNDFADQRTMTQLLNDKHMNTYVRKYGYNMTTNGQVASGEWMDIMLGIDWLRSEMEFRVFQLLMNNAKVPYDNEGIALIAAAVDSVLRDGVENDIIRATTGGVGEYDIVIPDISDVPTNDIALREFNLLTWTAKLKGAIHEVEINGVVTY